MTEPLSRRDFLKKIGKIGSATTLVAGGASLSACGILPEKSYMSQLNFTTDDPMNYWVDVMMKTTCQMPLNPPVASRAFAMAHLAGFLAVNGIEGKYNTPYNLQDGPRDADKNVAFGVAFSRAFAEGAQTSLLFDKMDFLSRYDSGEGKARGVAYGEYVSDFVINMRTQDGAQPSQSQAYLGRYPARQDALSWAPSGGFYGSKPGPEVGSFLRALLPGWGYVKPWVIRDKAQFLPPPYPVVNSLEFERMYEKIRLLGGANSTMRTQKQTEIAHFWEAGARTISPPGMWQLLALEITRDLQLPLIEKSRMYALMSMSQADVAIATWHSKFHYDILRPETAIRQRGDEYVKLGLHVVPDPTWESLLATPPFPAYTSGHSGFSTASAVVIASVIGRDDVSFSSEPLDRINWPEQLRGVRMTWNSLFHAAEEASNSREYGGIHWEIDHVEGLNLGRKIGKYVVENAFTLRA
jgi:hypothetical protein